MASFWDSIGFPVSGGHLQFQAWTKLAMATFQGANNCVDLAILSHSCRFNEDEDIAVSAGQKVVPGHEPDFSAQKGFAGPGGLANT